MANRVLINDVAVSASEGTDLRQLVSSQSPGASQAIVRRADGGMEVRRVSDLRGLAPGSVDSVRTMQQDLEQGLEVERCSRCRKLGADILTAGQLICDVCYFRDDLLRCSSPAAAQRMAVRTFYIRYDDDGGW